MVPFAKEEYTRLDIQRGTGDSICPMRGTSSLQLRQHRLSIFFPPVSAPFFILKGTSTSLRFQARILTSRPLYQGG